jgi:hypothetical protein
MEKTSASLPNLVGGIFSIVGLILIGLASWFGYRSYHFIERADTVPGIVKEFRTELRRDKDDNSTYTLYSPVFGYHYNGKDYTHQSPYGSSQPGYQVGDQVQLLIDPGNPKEPQEDSFMDNWFLPMLLGSLGLVFAGVGTVVMKAFRKP